MCTPAQGVSVAAQIEDRQAPLTDDDRLAIDEAGSHLQARHCFDDLREAIGEIIPVPGEKPHTIGIPARQDAEAIMLDFV